MRAILDTNVIIDVLARREPFFKDSVMVVDRAERGDFTACLCATTITTIFYLVRRSIGSVGAIEKLKDLTGICSTACVNQSVIDSALQSPFTDFEDAVLNHSAILAGADYIVTRNVKGFKHSTLLVYTPNQFIKALNQMT